MSSRCNAPARWRWCAGRPIPGNGRCSNGRIWGSWHGGWRLLRFTLDIGWDGGEKAPKSKFQAPEKHQKPSSKAEGRRKSLCSLEFDVSLELGTSDLELLSEAKKFIQIVACRCL